MNPAENGNKKTGLDGIRKRFVCTDEIAEWTNYYSFDTEIVSRIGLLVYARSRELPNIYIYICLYGINRKKKERKKGILETLYQTSRRRGSS